VGGLEGCYLLHVAFGDGFGFYQVHILGNFALQVSDYFDSNKVVSPERVSYAGDNYSLCV